VNLPAWLFSARASVSSHSAISSKPSSRAVFEKPGYISVYSYVSPVIAEFRLSAVAPTAVPVTGVAVGATTDNLQSAVTGETYEYTEMYPGFARTARDEGFEEIAEWLETLARAEKSHAGRFQQGLESVS
jgi:hypothetical protein